MLYLHRQNGYNINKVLIFPKNIFLFYNVFLLTQFCSKFNTINALLSQKYFSLDYPEGSLCISKLLHMSCHLFCELMLSLSSACELKIYCLSRRTLRHLSQSRYLLDTSFYVSAIPQRDPSLGQPSSHKSHVVANCSRADVISD